MIAVPPAPLSTIAQLSKVAQQMMQRDGNIDLGTFVNALSRGPKAKFGAMLEAYRRPFIGLSRSQMRTVYEVLLRDLDRAFPGMTCGIDGWRFGLGYTSKSYGTTPTPGFADNRLGHRALDLEARSHPDAFVTIAGTHLPATTWYRPARAPAWLA